MTAVLGCAVTQPPQMKVNDIRIRPTDQEM